MQKLGVIVKKNSSRERCSEITGSLTAENAASEAPVKIFNKIRRRLEILYQKMKKAFSNTIQGNLKAFQYVKFLFQGIYFSFPF